LGGDTVARDTEYNGVLSHTPALSPEMTSGQAGEGDEADDSKGFSDDGKWK
jgi:hypothetical protein